MVRNLLKAKRDLIKVGVEPDSEVIELIDTLIAQYRQRVGLQNYLSQMLGDLAQVPAESCRLYQAGGKRIPVDTGAVMPVQKYIARRVISPLPFRVTCGDQERIL